MPFKKIIVTSGEPAGIGVDLCLRLANIKTKIPLVILGDIAVIKQRQQKTNNNALNIIPIQDLTQNIPNNQPNTLFVHPITVKEPVIAGKPNKNNVPYILKQLAIANKIALADKNTAILTLPIHKGIINQYQTKQPFSGHTEYFQKASKSNSVLMMLASKKLKVATLTTHIPLAQVAKAINTKLLQKSLEIAYDALQKYSLYQHDKPHITVLGLNPHCGEDGHIGKEEQTIIQPVIKKLQNQGINIAGPVSADTAFSKEKMAQTDLYLGMYHDQVLPIFKHNSFYEGVNITLGLPYLRVSVDHGTALDKAGLNSVNSGSMEYAIRFLKNLQK